MDFPAIAFSGGPFDHDETGRAPQDLQLRLDDKNAYCILLHQDGPLLDKNGHLQRLSPKQLIGKNLRDPGPLYLGYDGDNPVFAAILQNISDAPHPAQPENLRNVASKMPASDLALAGRATSLFEWHITHRYCPNCGSGTQNMMGGLKRGCISCKAEHFPRVNPVVIMLVTHQDHVLLGRQASWPEGSYSALAGFVSPGETIEEACYREVWEEVGLSISNAAYMTSQPWPFPSQLMIGLSCTANQRELTINHREIESAQWVRKEALRAVIAKVSKDFYLPPRFTIARQLLERWAAID